MKPVPTTDARGARTQLLQWDEEVSWNSCSLGVRGPTVASDGRRCELLFQVDLGAMNQIVASWCWMGSLA